MHPRPALAAAVVVAAPALAGCDTAPRDDAPAGTRTAYTAGGASGGMPRGYTVAGGAASPGGIAYEPFNGCFFVSSARDGAVFRAHVMDSVLTPFLPAGGGGRVAAAGLALDGSGRLYVAGAGTGTLFVHDAASGALVHRFAAPRGPGPAPRLTDVVVTYGDVAYVTDASAPVIYRVAPDSAGHGLATWLDLERAMARKGPVAPLSAIDATPGGAYLLVAQGTTGKLFRIDTRTKRATEIALAGESVPGAEDLLLVESTLYVVRRSPPQLVKIALASDLTAGVVTDTLTPPALAGPTAVVEAGNRLLVVNSRAGGGLGGAPTVSSVPTP